MDKVLRNKKIIAIIIIIMTFVIGCNSIKNVVKNEERYLASNVPIVALYTEEFEEIELPRGLKVKYLNKKVKKNDQDKESYEKIKYNDKIYLISNSNLVKEAKKSVLEEKVYVRTPVTVLKNNNDSEIVSMVKKGEELEILDYDKINDQGEVNKYKIKYQSIEGYVYGKYLVSSHEKSLEKYSDLEEYSMHNKRGDSLGGGSASNLDYFPRVKPKFTDNIMPDEVRSLYIAGGAVHRMEEYIRLAKEYNMNALVIDIKDSGVPSYKSPVMEKYSESNFKNGILNFEKYKELIKKANDAGLYTIGRISVFKDSLFVKDNPERSIASTATGEPILHNNSYWPSAFDRVVWQYNLELAKEASIEMGFNEIQFDYVRFPDRLYNLEKEGKIDLKNKYNEDKAQAIQGFLMYATDELHNENIYVSADVFGESAHTYVTGYGQYWGAISNVVDVISGMPYPDHFGAYDYGFKEIVWTVPGKLLKFWGENYVQKRQQEIPSPAIVRTWIQAYDAIRSPYIKYDAEKISEQITGLYEAGLTGGYMPWNSISSITRYESYAEAFKKNYLG